jgi:arsenical pump membrane protein
MPLITSNPINILSADFFKYTFLDHLMLMVPVTIATITSSILLVYFFFRKKIPKVYDTSLLRNLEENPHIKPGLLKICISTLIVIDIGYVFASLEGIPVSFIICSGAIFLFLVYWRQLRERKSLEGEKKGLKQIAREINWDIILFMFSIFVVVQGLKNRGFVGLLASALVSSSLLPSVLGVFVPSLIIMIGASFMNNWPMTILGLLSIRQAIEMGGLSGQALTGLIFSNVIGNNLGPHFFPLGSLAILMWMECLRRKGVSISLKEYLKVGAALSILEVAVASLCLWVELSLGLSL